MTDNATAIPVPENWDDLTDDEKDAVAAELLKAAYEQAKPNRS